MEIQGKSSLNESLDAIKDDVTAEENLKQLVALYKKKQDNPNVTKGDLWEILLGLPDTPETAPLFKHYYEFDIPKRA
jgi:hypothetical protein